MRLPGGMPVADAASAGESAVPGEASGGGETGSARDEVSDVIHDTVARGDADSTKDSAFAADDESAGAKNMNTPENTEGLRSGDSDETTDSQPGISGETTGSLSAIPDKMANPLPDSSREATLDQKIRLLPAKIAASKVTPGLADRLLEDENGGDGGEIRARLELLRTSSKSFASLLGEGKAVLATDRGTAAHEFLQFCDYDRLMSDGIESEFDRLVREKFITPRTAEIADREALTKFLTSDLFRLIKKAKKAERRGTVQPVSALCGIHGRQAAESRAWRPTASCAGLH